MSGWRRVIYERSCFVPVSSNAVLETPGTVSLLSSTPKVNGEELKYKLICKLQAVACQDNLRQGPGTHRISVITPPCWPRIIAYRRIR